MSDAIAALVGLHNLKLLAGAIKFCKVVVSSSLSGVNKAHWLPVLSPEYTNGKSHPGIGEPPVPGHGPVSAGPPV